MHWKRVVFIKFEIDSFFNSIHKKFDEAGQTCTKLVFDEYTFGRQ